jgi:hypothetical protein
MQASGDYGRALFALGRSMLTPALVILALRATETVRVVEEDRVASVR